MAVSVTTRPSAWSAVKNPIVYKFTTTGGPFVNYRIEVEVFKASDDSSLTGGIKFSFTPDADGITYADISEILKAFLKPEWIKPADVTETEEGTSLKYYIKYLELYDESATSVVDDVANKKQAVYGALQIPSASGNDLDAYVPEDVDKKFLRVFDNLKMWRGYPATLSFIYEDEASIILVREQRNAAGALIKDEADDIALTDSRAAVGRIDLLKSFALDDAAKSLKAQLMKIDGGVDSDTGVTAPIDKTIALPHSYPAGDYRFQGGLFIIPAGLANLALEVYITDGVNEHQLTTTVALANSVIIFTADSIESVAFAFDQIRFVITETSGNSFNYDFSGGPLIPASEPLTLPIEDPCNNPVMLVWKNSLGGDAQWLFDVDQEVSYSTSGSKKAKRMMLSANNLTADQWEALNELTHIGEVYKENIIEFSISVNKSHVRDGSQVYVLDEDGNKTGVIVIPTNNVMFTKMKRHQFKVEIEFPERYE